MSAQFPNVPNAPGVPAVARIANDMNQVIASAAVLVADAAIIRQMFETPIWGLFQNNKPLFAGANVVSVEMKKGYRNASHPVEQGSFASYNKVEEPYDARITIAIDGTTVLGSVLGTLDVVSAALGQRTAGVENRHKVLELLDWVTNSMQLYQVVMPEYTYGNANVVRYEYDRKAQGGVSMIVVTLYVQEVRVVAPVGYANTQNAEGADPVNQGAPQTTAPTPAQTPPAAASVSTATGASGAISI